ncbi:MAG: DNA adenine methylase [Oscillospiraceae bacterium]|nr:DNA adenine methylase [Oscillospiraceae bacterium]
MQNQIKPFIKWAGGKQKLLQNIRTTYPEKIVRYCEPFVGGGAVLLDVLANHHPQNVLINDINPELINAYIQVQKSPEDLIQSLHQLENCFLNAEPDTRKQIYLEKRNRFNALLSHSGNQYAIEKASLFIFLNKTCFNGLYRVNQKGEYNVPMGRYKTPCICDAHNLMNVSRALRNAEIRCGDYSQCLDFIDRNTFVYLDPPYRPLSDTASFTAYSPDKFQDAEQIALKKFIDRITEKGAKFTASNSDPRNSNDNDDFFDNLYQNYHIRRIIAKRTISCKGAERGDVSELLICNG